jgi:hypothetical protein
MRPEFASTGKDIASDKESLPPNPKESNQVGPKQGKAPTAFSRRDAGLRLGIQPPLVKATGAGEEVVGIGSKERGGGNGCGSGGDVCLGVDPVVPKFVGINSHSILEGVGIVAAEAEQRCATPEIPKIAESDASCTLFWNGTFVI